MSSNSQMQNGWIETQRITSPSTRIIPRRERRCGICRSLRHIATYCNHPDIPVMATIVIDNCRYMYQNNVHLTPTSDTYRNYLECLPLSLLKMVCKYFEIPMSLNKRMCINVLTERLHSIFEREFGGNLLTNSINILIAKPEHEPQSDGTIEEQDMCPICQDETIAVDNFITTNCSHKFCCSCIIGVINYNKRKSVLNCPMCRTQITTLMTSDRTNYHTLSNTMLNANHYLYV